jgi:hypothetical protein
MKLQGLEEHPHNLGIELHTGALLELLEGRAVRQGFAISAVRGHRIVGIGDRYDPPHQGNLVAFQALRITAAIEILMMTVGSGDQLAQKGNRLEDSPAFLRMRTKVDRFLPREASGLILLLRRIPYLPNIMNLC